MSTIEAITTAIAQLPPAQVAQIRAWLEEYEECQWGEQIARTSCRPIGRAGRAGTGRTQGWADAAPMPHHTTADFWDCYARMPEEV